MRQGYDLEQLKLVRAVCKVPLIAWRRRGHDAHFRDAFTPGRRVDGRWPPPCSARASFPFPN